MQRLTNVPRALRCFARRSVIEAYVTSLRSAQCQQQYKVACYGPAQVQQAYHLGPLYAQQVTGKGTTIVIVDSYGSPTIKNDLAVFDRAYKLPAPPK